MHEVHPPTVVSPYPRRRPGPRALSRLSLAQIQRRHPPYALVVQWVRAGRVMGWHALARLAWPDPRHPRWPRTTAEALTRLVTAGLIEVIPGDPLAVQLGRRGAQILRHAGIRSRYNPPPGETARTNLLLASAVGSALAQHVRTSPGVTGFTWSAQPFAGRGVRPDATGTLIWRPDDLTVAPSVIATPLASVPCQSADTRRLTLCVEIDRMTERGRTVQQRVQRWVQALADPPAAGLPDGPLLVVWITTGGARRSHTLWRCWRDHTDHPAAFTNAITLQHAGDGSDLDLLRARWRTTALRWTTGRTVLSMLSRG